MAAQPDAVLLVEQAEGCVRALIHCTRPCNGEPSGPDQAARLIVALADITAMLPQLFNQLTRWVDHQHSGGHLRADAETVDTNQLVHDLTASLQRASVRQRQAAHDLDEAHQHAARLAAGPSRPSAARMPT